MLYDTLIEPFADFGFMRRALVASLALHVHYSTETEPCSINEKWDCGIVNHSPYAVIGPVPVAAIGLAG